MPETSTALELVPILFVVACAVIAVVFVLTTALLVRRSRRIRRAGHDPLTLQADLAVRALQSDLLRPARSTAERLHELDELQHRRGISPNEYVRARERVLSGL